LFAATWSFVSSSLCLGNIGPSSAFGDANDESEFVAQDEGFVNAAVAHPSADPCPPCPLPLPCGSRSIGDEEFVDAAVADPSAGPCPPCPPHPPCGSRATDATNPSLTSTTQPQSTENQGWVIGLAAMFGVIAVLLLAVIVKLAVVLRSRP